VSDVKAIVGMQDVRAGGVVKTCETGGQEAIVRLQCSTSAADHLPDTAIVPGGPTVWRHDIN
jgi:hypothetical protein